MLVLSCCYKYIPFERVQINYYSCMTNEEGYLWTRESIFEKYPIALKLTHVIFGQKSYWFRWGLRDTFGFAQAWTARHFWTVEDLKTYRLLRADILWILRLQGRKRAEIRYSFSFLKPFHLFNTPLFIFKMNELEYQFFLFTVPAIMTLILIGVAVKFYRKCKDSKYIAFPVPGETDDI